MSAVNDFSNILLDWNRTSNYREMPWKGEKDPYLVWLSEIILQQTRVEQGMPYFLRFKEAYPTVKHLADAPEDDVMRHWQGLGYYSRARNLHSTARYIAYELTETFPSSYEEIKKMKGIGPYTAAAISSFVFGERQAVLDGNVIRVLSRIHGIDEPFDTTEGRKVFATLAQRLISHEYPGEYNQAIMDFGAQICVPVKPQCEICPFSGRCIAYRDNRQDELPVRAKRIIKRTRYFYYIVLKSDTEIIISKRKAGDIWQGLYELPMIESDKPIRRNLQKIVSDYMGRDTAILNYSKPYKQQLTHQTIHSVFLFVDSIGFEDILLEGTIKIPLKKLHTFGFPKVVHLFLQENSLL